MERESYGEDIANTETEKSDRSDEDDYDDSFINDDGDLAVFSASPISNEEEASSDGGRKSAKGSRRRLRKKYHLVESDDDSGLEGKKTVNDSVHVQSQEIDDEDSLPISSLCKKNKSFVRVLDQEMEDCFDKEAIDAGEKDSDNHENSIIETKLKTDNAVTESQIHREAEPSDQLTVPSTVPDVGDNKKSKKKKKGKEKETSTELDNAAQDEPKMNTSQYHFDQEMHDNIDRETVDAGKKDGEDHENSATETKLETDNAVADSQTHSREAEPSDHLVDPCTVPDVGDIKKSKKKKKGKEKETKSSSNGDSTELDNAAQDEPKMNTAQDLLDQEMVDNVDKEAVDDGKKDGEDRENITIETKLKTDNVVADIQTHSREAEPSDQLAVPSTVPDVGDMKKSKKKKKGKEKETKSSSNEHSTDLDNAAQDEPKMNTDEDLLAGNEQHQQQPNDKKAETTDKILPSSQVGQGQDEKPKKKRKERSKVTLFIADDACISNVVNLPQGNEHSNQDTVNGRDVKIADSVALPSSETDSQKKTKRRKKEQINKASHPEGDNRNGEGIIQDYKADKETAESDGLSDKFSEKKEQHPKLTIENVDNGAQDNPDGNQSEDKKVKKKKKKSKSQGSEVVNSDVPVSVEQSTEMMEEDGNNVEDTKPSQVRTLSNGLVIQELETGKENGKIAAVGKKISINYTGKLKENGVVIESNAGEAPFKFRLGKGEVIEGWDIGLEGMRVGEKRRLVVPPSMTSKKDGESENIPPNSWLVYDFELVKVH